MMKSSSFENYNYLQERTELAIAFCSHISGVYSPFQTEVIQTLAQFDVGGVANLKAMGGLSSGVGVSFTSAFSK